MDLIVSEQATVGVNSCRDSNSGKVDVGTEGR